MRRGKQLPPIPGFGVVNGVQDSRVGGKHDAGIPIILVGTQITQRHIRQIVLKIVLCLLHQRGAVGQKQNVGHPFASAEHIGQAGRGSGFAGAGGHHQQMLAEPLIDLAADRPDGFFLIIPVGDFVVDGNAHQIQPLRAAVHQPLQIVFAENAADFSLGASLIVPEICFKAVGGEYHGAAAKFPFQAIRV